MSIITGRGDSGESDLLFGKRIAKGAIRLDALGDVDELNAALGVARAEAGEGESSELIDTIQHKLVGLMGQLATLPEDEACTGALIWPSESAMSCPFRTRSPIPTTG